MEYPELQLDFNNLRNAHPFNGILLDVLNEAENYINFLEQRKAVLENAIAYLNQVDDSGLNETKEQILAGFSAVVNVPAV